MAWVSDALCAQTDPDAFFPDDGVVPRSAKAVCRVCPVREACLAFAMAHGELYHGVWGGLSALERRALRARIAVGVAA
jgi:WhiB family redox-sensing transcriptional regulator